MQWGYTTNGAGGDGRYIYTTNSHFGRVDSNGNQRFGC